MTPEYAKRLKQGLAFERFLGENEAPGEVEIKRDGRFRDTGNLYIEVLERPDIDSPWNPCGPFHREKSKMYKIKHKTLLFCVFR